MAVDKKLFNALVPYRKWCYLIAAILLSYLLIFGIASALQRNDCVVKCEDNNMIYHDADITPLGDDKCYCETTSATTEDGVPFWFVFDISNI